METLDFKYKASETYSLIDAETARHAAFLRYQDGGSAYDDLKLHTNDRPTIEGCVADAFRSIVTRFDGESKYTTGEDIPEGGGDKCEMHGLTFYLPDFDDSLYENARDEISRYVVTSATARWLMNRSFGEYAKMVAEDANASLVRLITMLRTRKFPLD